MDHADSTSDGGSKWTYYRAPGFGVVRHGCREQCDSSACEDEREDRLAVMDLDDDVRIDLAA